MTEAEQKTDLERILRDPAQAYESPLAVLRDEALDDDQKLRVLQSWEFDARELSVAEQENMTGGEENKLSLVREAMNELTEKMGIEVQHLNAIPTGQGMHTRTPPPARKNRTPEELRQGETSGRLRAVLIVSTLLAAAGLVVAYTMVVGLS